MNNTERQSLPKIIAKSKSLGTQFVESMHKNFPNDIRKILNTDESRLFKVVYEIEVEADDAHDAALQTEQIFKDMNYRPFLKVTSPDGKMVEIDLEQEIENS